jgi:hypothetical protein
MTPVLICARRGLMDMLRYLVSVGGDKTVSDKVVRRSFYSLCFILDNYVLSQLRTGLYYAAKSGHNGMVKQFLKPETVNQAEAVWVST